MKYYANKVKPKLIGVYKKINFTLLWIFVGTFSRLIPHPPNITALTMVSLFAGSQLPAKLAFPSLFISLILSDTALHYLNHYPVFGTWTLFTYSGFAFIILLGRKLSIAPSQLRLFVFLLISTLGYWLWTNAGVWFEGLLYPRNISGLIACYIAALPFLRNAFLGNLVWIIVIFGGYRKLVILSASEGSETKKILRLRSE